MELIEVSRGGLNILYSGYSYIKKAEKIRWECSKRKGKCPTKGGEMSVELSRGKMPGVMTRGDVGGMSYTR